MQWNPGSCLVNPVSEVQDGASIFYALNPESKGAYEVAQDYGTQSENQDPRMVSVRLISDVGVGQWEGFIPICASTEPVTSLSWNQGSPSQGYVPKADVLDNGTHFNAENPDGWSLEQCARDYGEQPGICENREPHEVQVREVSQVGNGEYEMHVVPMEPEE